MFIGCVFLFGSFAFVVIFQLARVQCAIFAFAVAVLLIIFGFVFFCRWYCWYWRWLTERTHVMYPQFISWKWSFCAAAERKCRVAHSMFCFLPIHFWNRHKTEQLIMDERKVKWKMAQPFIMMSSEPNWWIDFCGIFLGISDGLSDNGIQVRSNWRDKCNLKRIHDSHSLRWQKTIRVSVTIIQIAIFGMVHTSVSTQ